MPRSLISVGSIPSKSRSLYAAGALLALAGAVGGVAGVSGVAKGQEIAKSRVTLIGTASVPGDASDLSGLTGEAAPECPQSRLGSYGSGIDSLGKDNLFVTVTDRGPGDGASTFVPRLQIFEIVIDPAKAQAVQVNLKKTVLLKSPAGNMFTGSLLEQALIDGAKSEGGWTITKRFDPEGVRLLPNGNVLITDEYGPFAAEFSLDGKGVSQWSVPQSFVCQVPGNDEKAEMPPANTKGRIPNRGLESLAVTKEGVAWSMLQSPLIQDGGLGKKNWRVGMNIRVIKLGKNASDSHSSQSQFVYQLDSENNGVNEMLAVSETAFLILERDGKKATSRRIYLAETIGATDVAPITQLPSTGLPEGVKPMSKRLLLDLLDPSYGLAGNMPEKIEGLAWGPDLGDGRKTLIVTSDNDMIAEQPSWFWVFALEPKVFKGE